MIRFLNSRTPIPIFLFLIISFYISYQMNLFVEVSGSYFFLGKWINEVFISIESVWWRTIISFSLISLFVFLINILNNRFNIIRESYNLPLFVSFFLLFQSKEIFVSPALIIGYLLVIPAFFILFEIYKSEKIINQLFQIGLLIAIASLFYLDLIIYIVLIPILVIAIKGIINAKQALAFLLGILTVTELVWGTHYFITANYAYPLAILKQYFGAVHPIRFHLENNWIQIIGLSVLFLLSNLLYFRKNSRLNINVRLYFKSMGFLFFSTIILYLLLPFTGESLWLNCLFSLSFLFSNYFLNIKRTFLANILFVSLIGVELSIFFI